MNDMINDALNKGLISFEKSTDWLQRALTDRRTHSRLTLDLVDSLPMQSLSLLDKRLSTRVIGTTEFGKIERN